MRYMCMQDKWTDRQNCRRTHYALMRGRKPQKLELKLHNIFQLKRTTSAIHIKTKITVSWLVTVGFSIPLDTLQIVIDHFRDKLPSQSLGWYYHTKSNGNQVTIQKNLNNNYK